MVNRQAPTPRSTERLLNLRSLLPVIATCALATSTEAQVDFAQDIRPILNANCTECHGGVKAAGRVSFVYEDRVINFEGKSGFTTVIPKNLEESELYYRITTDDEEERMPPADHHPMLSSEEVALIKQWIEEGAKWSEHWAFVPPKKPSPPQTAFDDQAKGEIDRFLFRQLESEGLAPSPAESPRRLLRRLGLALTGLPPSLEELDAFETAYAKNAKRTLKKTVDGLLERPAFGERWATVWLDLVRYADSGGLGQDQKRTIWAYRDWVVDALNNDLPFDEFTIKQLAGDLLPNPTLNDLIATASHRNTQTNDEGGTDDEAFRVEAVVDRVNTTWQTWGSITFSCVQCHDHPYDPIRHDEYYRFMDFFNNTADSDLPKDEPLLKIPEDPKQLKKSAQMRQRILDQKEKLWQKNIALRDASHWSGLKGIAVKSNNTTQYETATQALYDEFQTVGTVATKTHTLISIPEDSLKSDVLHALKLNLSPWDPETSIHSPEWGFLISDLQAKIVSEDGNESPVTFRASIPDVPWMPTQPIQAIEANGKNWGANSRIHYLRQLVLIPQTAIQLKEGETLELRIHCDKTGHGSHPMAIQRGHVEFSSDPHWIKFQAKGGSDFKARQTLLSTIEAYQKIPGTTVPIMQRRPDQLSRPTHIFLRGNAMDKGDLIASGLPASLTRVAANKKNPNRLDMAQWWVSDDNPLTARVFVNRIWEQLFGVGIVPTLEDFGSSGEKPTHPELLDYLAIRFQRDYQWSIKSVIREIVLSHAFQQSSRITPELLKRDPENRLLARGPRLRLSAEMVRDQALALSGLLSEKRGGPPVHPPIPEGVWQPFLSKDKWETPEAGNEDRYRRSLYTYVKRSIPYPTFASFDAPSREFCSPRRLNSNTPLQALVTLNDESFYECAVALGKRLRNEYPTQLEEALDKGYALATGRKANPDKLQALVDLYNKAYLKSPDEAWTTLAQVLLNLDETLTY
ncbi:MAG: PSD1 and planctomycete cytochrome C domain-containing protein [Verrucomicrobiota bacterium]